MVILAGLAEFVGGVLMILGFLRPLATLALIRVMIVAGTHGAPEEWLLQHQRGLRV
jgi:uncharacterized membrane protein YphA (DoxX/SURF4 family)